MIKPEVRKAVEGNPLVHLATILPTGGPHTVPIWIGTYRERIAFVTDPDSRKARNLRNDPRLAMSFTVAGNPKRPMLVRGYVADWLTGSAADEVIDSISMKYIGRPYSRDEIRVVALVEVEQQAVGHEW